MKRLATWFHNLVFGANIIAVLLLGLSYLSAILKPEDAGPFSFLGLIYPVLLGMNIFFIIYWAFNKPKRCLLSILAILLGVYFIPRLYALGSGDKRHDADLKMMTFNLTGYSSWEKGSGTRPRKRHVDSLVQLIGKQELDLIFIQEDQHGFKEEFIKKMKDYNHVTIPSGRLDIYSKYPIGSFNFVPLRNRTNGILTSELYTSNDTILLINAHLTSNKIKSKDISEISSDKIDQRKTWSAVKKSLMHYQEYGDLRIKDYQILDSLISSSPYKSIIAGDFNEIPMSRLYSNFSKTHKDAFVEAGRGIGPTFSDLFGLLRIDYIFVDRSYDVTYYEVLNTSFSDHYPVIAHISLASHANN